jgi:hypothetical protein
MVADERHTVSRKDVGTDRPSPEHVVDLVQGTGPSLPPQISSNI